MTTEFELHGFFDDAKGHYSLQELLDRGLATKMAITIPNAAGTEKYTHYGVIVKVEEETYNELRGRE